MEDVSLLSAISAYAWMHLDILEAIFGPIGLENHPWNAPQKLESRDETVKLGSWE
jgi:hypothetical protein